jgi:aryl-alcohol dehydrogenase-like predicted oxidoreductase
VPPKEAVEILNTAMNLGIDTIDTASAYGESEKVIGSFVKDNKSDFKIISKLPKCSHKDVGKIVDTSLARLNTPSLYGYLIHSFENYKSDPQIWEELEKLKKKGKIEKIGFSLYCPYELETLFSENLKIDIIQVPYSIFDQRFNESFVKSNKKGIEVYARSIFLQGLVFKKPGQLDPQFSKIKDKIELLNALSQELGISVVALCVNFVRLEKFIDKIVVGVDSVDNLKEIMSAGTYDLKVKANVNRLSDLREEDEKIILPFNWNLERNN